jgi:hypothetical protein
VIYSKQEEGPRQTLPYTLRCTVISERLYYLFWLIPILADNMIVD